jgi:uncharacterized protein (TIGR02246 family)
MNADHPREAVIAAGKRHYEAAIAGDTSTVASLLCDEVAYTHSNGLREGKSGYLEKVASGLYRGLKLEYSASEVWVFDDVAVVTATQLNSGQVGSHDWTTPQESVSLDVWCRRDGRWQLLAHQVTLVRRPRPQASRS